MTTFRRIAIVSALVASLLAGMVGSAYALQGDLYHEGLNGGPGWRGVAGNTYVYDWTVKSPDGTHVSSFYVHDVPYNPFSGDGYNDGLLHNWVHMEVGVSTQYGTGPRVFWQWNKTPDALDDWALAFVTTIPATNVWAGEFKIGNVSMGSESPETWHLNWSGQTMTSVSMPLVTGLALCSAERAYLDWMYPPLGDSNMAWSKTLERKNSGAYWKPWVDATPIANGDGYYSFTKVSETELWHSR